jgi:hypothetical protein
MQAWGFSGPTTSLRLTCVDVLAVKGQKPQVRSLVVALVEPSPPSPQLAPPCQ